MGIARIESETRWVLVSLLPSHCLEPASENKGELKKEISLYNSHQHADREVSIEQCVARQQEMECVAQQQEMECTVFANKRKHWVLSHRVLGRTISDQASVGYYFPREKNAAC